MLSEVSFTLCMIFPSTVHIFPKPYSSLTAHNLLIHNFVKLSIMKRFLPFNLFLLLKTFYCSEYLTNCTIMGRCLFSVFAPTWWVWLISFTLISISISDLIVWITTSSEGSSFWRTVPVCLSAALLHHFFFSKKGTRSYKHLIYLSSFFMYSVYSSNFFYNLVKWTFQIFELLFTFNLAFYSGVCYFIYLYYFCF